MDSARKPSEKMSFAFFLTSLGWGGGCPGNRSRRGKWAVLQGVHVDRFRSWSLDLLSDFGLLYRKVEKMVPRYGDYWSPSAGPQLCQVDFSPQGASLEKTTSLVGPVSPESGHAVQGYLAYEKPPPRRTLP